MKKYVIYSERATNTNTNTVFYVTSEENYNRRIQNAREIKRMDGFTTVEEVIDYWVKWFGVEPEDFIVRTNANANATC